MAKNKQSKQAKDYADLGRSLVSIYESGYINRRSAYKFSFIKGVLAGAGGVIGATVLIAMLLFILSIFSDTPIVGPFFKDVKTTVESIEK